MRNYYHPCYYTLCKNVIIPLKKKDGGLKTSEKKFKANENPDFFPHENMETLSLKGLCKPDHLTPLLLI